MAEASDQAAAPEPSMEEILASIRKIIADEPSADGAPAQPVDQNGADVIELTNMVQDDGSVVDLKPAVAEGPAQTMSDNIEFAPVPAAEPLASESAVQASASALSSLANTVQIERIASNPSLGSYLGNGGRTLEDMVLEIMRPLLKEWLDKNLPATVDRLVQKEIERIARKVP